jgi:hypothetical protein
MDGLTFFFTCITADVAPTAEVEVEVEVDGNPLKKFVDVLLLEPEVDVADLEVEEGTEGGTLPKVKGAGGGRDDDDDLEPEVEKEVEKEVVAAPKPKPMVVTPAAEDEDAASD